MGMYQKLTTAEREAYAAANRRSRIDGAHEFSRLCTANGTTIKNQAATRRLLDEEFGFDNAATRRREPALVRAVQRLNSLDGDEPSSRADMSGLPGDKDGPFLIPDPDPDIIVPRLDWGDVPIALASDLHGPYWDKDFMERCLALSRRERVRHLVLMGDIVDNAHFSKRGRNMRMPEQWWRHWKRTRECLARLREWFDVIQILCGNHDQWLNMALRGEVPIAEFLQDLTNVDGLSWTEFEQLALVHSGRQHVLMHGANVSSPNPLGVAKEMAKIMNASVTMGHQHWAEQGMVKVGHPVFGYIDLQATVLGGWASQKKFLYVHQSPRRYPRQMQSFGLLRDGWVEEYRPERPNW